MKKKIIIFVLLTVLAFTGCSPSYVKVKSANEQIEDEPVTSMFVNVEEGPYWKVYYHKDTKVMYVMSSAIYNYGNFTVLVNPDGSPMIYDENE